MRQRRPWLAVILSLVQPGVGHLYAGSLKRAAIAFSGMLLLVFIIRMLLLGSIALLVAAAILALCAWFAITWDAARWAREAETGELRWFQRWYVYLAATLIAIFAIQPVLGPVYNRWTRYQGFKIPSRAMENTVLVGDVLMADMWAYRSREPNRGELVVFRYPPEPERDFIKRCVAVPGDTVEIRDKVLYLNGENAEEDYVTFRDSRTILNAAPAPRSIRTRDNFGPFTVPSASIFVLGDNRDNSHDSRVWGVVSYDLLRGKALYVYWGETVDRIGIDLE